MKLEMFDKVRAAALAVVAAAGAAALTKAAGLNWTELVAPLPDWSEGAAILAAGGAIATARAWWAREFRGYGTGEITARDVDEPPLEPTDAPAAR